MSYCLVLQDMNIQRMFYLYFMKLFEGKDNTILPLKDWQIIGKLFKAWKKKDFIYIFLDLF
jgi:hypothetical protein